MTGDIFIVCIGVACYLIGVKNDMPRAANSLYKHGFDDSDDLTNRWSQAHSL